MLGTDCTWQQEVIYGSVTVHSLVVAKKEDG